MNGVRLLEGRECTVFAVGDGSRAGGRSRSDRQVRHLVGVSSLYADFGSEDGSRGGLDRVREGTNFTSLLPSPMGWLGECREAGGEAGVLTLGDDVFSTPLNSIAASS